MPTITYVSADGSVESVEVPVGTTIMQGAVGAGIDGIVAECGGNAMCATCHVYVDPGHEEHLPAVSTVEDELLECTAVERRKSSRLSCRIGVTPELEGLRVHLPEEQQ